MTEPVPPPAPASPWARRIRHAVSAIFLIGAVVGVAGMWYFSHGRSVTDNAYVVGNITPVSSEVGGTVVALYADDNMVLKAGDPVAQIDPVPYQYAVDQALADYRQAEADLRAAEVSVDLVTRDRKALLEGAKARQSEAAQAVKAGEVEVINRERLHEKEEEVLAAQKARLPGMQAIAANAREFAARSDKLARTGDLPVQDRDNREAASREAAARLEQLKSTIAAAERQVLASAQQVQETRVRLEQARKALDAAAASVGQAEAAQLQPEVAVANRTAARGRLGQAEARLRLARLALSNCLVRAPQDGIVSRRTIQLGQTVTARQSFLSLVPLDLGNVWVVANLREEQLSGLRVGQAASVTIDAIPGRTFPVWVESVGGGTGTVFSVFPADNATGNFTRVVQRLPVRLRFADAENFENRIRPGMSARVVFDEARIIRRGAGPW
jgi:membrane fusion protein (multidrug efflux system)